MHNLHMGLKAFFVCHNLDLILVLWPLWLAVMVRWGGMHTLELNIIYPLMGYSLPASSHLSGEHTVEQPLRHIAQIMSQLFAVYSQVFICIWCRGGFLQLNTFLWLHMDPKTKPLKACSDKHDIVVSCQYELATLFHHA